MKQEEIVLGPTPNTYWTQGAVNERIAYLKAQAARHGGQLVGMQDIEVDTTTREPIEVGSGGRPAQLLEFDLPDGTVVPL